MQIGLEADIAEIRATEDFGLRIAIDPLPLLDNAHERLVLVSLPVHAPELSVTHGAFEQDVCRDEHATHHLDCRGREVRRERGRAAEFLEYFGGMPVSGRFEGAHGALALWMGRRQTRRVPSR